MNKKIKICVIGSGYVGMSLAVLLAKNNNVIVHDIDDGRIDKINKMQSTIEDQDISRFLKEEALSLEATLDSNLAYKDADFIIVATPTNYDPLKNFFDTSSVDSVVEEAIKLNKNALIIIKSTIPIGHTNKLQEKFLSKNIIFSPEFLREGMALKDNLYPSRIVVGSECEKAKQFAALLKDAAIKKDIDELYIDSSDAEAVKLFANTYLAMRVSFFNELDSYALQKGLNSKNIIDGISLDNRIGKNYNNPSFGYGGYCLPKDTKQLLANYEDIPQSLIMAIVESNKKRKDFLSKKILEKSPKVIGIYRLAMKKDSDNFRSSAIHDLIKILQENKIKIIIYESTLTKDYFDGLKVIHDLSDFKSSSELIVANRVSKELDDVEFKVFTRDIYQNN